MRIDTEADRKRVCAAFNDMYTHLTDQEYAKRLGISERTARSLRVQDRAPQKKTAHKMADIMGKVHNFASMTDAELHKALEEIRQANERKQLKIALGKVIDESVIENAPNWLARASQLLDEGKYEAASAVMIDRLHRKEIKNLNENLRPFAWNKLGLSFHFQGREIEATDAFNAAIECGIRAKISPRYLAYFRTNLAGSLVRSRDFEGALDKCVQATDQLSFHLQGYYVALCAVNGMRDVGQLGLWIGRTIGAAKKEVDTQELEEFVTRTATDPDLEWARQQDTWLELDKVLRSIIKSAERQFQSAG